MSRRSAGFSLRGRSAEHGFNPVGRSAEHGFDPIGRSAEHGFTLIEVMVALAVFSLAALALIRLEGATLRSAAVLDNAVLGRIVARNVAVEAVTGPAPAAGQSAGVEQNGGRAWRWTRQVTATGDSRILRVDVAVLDATGGVVARLTMVRPPDVTATVS